MGLLAESKTRRIIQRDPNNTKWTRDETTFGKKILRAQGWEPGQYLGAKDAAHSEFHTAANASYIRVALKDDMKGLGYQKAKENEVTGLDRFSDVLSRLNGKSSAEVEGEQAARLIVKTHRYVEQKFGPMRFVRGGLLVGDTMKEVVESGSDSSAEEATSPVSNTDMELPPKPSKKVQSKKRKAELYRESSESSDEDEEDKKRRKKQRKEERNAKKEKKEAKKSKKAKRRQETVGAADAPDQIMSVDDLAEDTKASKKAKKERQKEKWEKKEKRDKKSKKKQRHGSDNPDTEMSGVIPKAAVSTTTTGTSTPIGTGATTPIANRNYVRSRFIANKKQAVMDTAALNQIFMIKAPS